MCYIIHYRDLVFMVNALCSACTLVIVSYTCITWLVSWSSRIQQETGFSESLTREKCLPLVLKNSGKNSLYFQTDDALAINIIFPSSIGKIWNIIVNAICRYFTISFRYSFSSDKTLYFYIS